ncbi:Wzt carbohydrate-binding domain-containing protein [Paraburkholderia atlantica]|uniref:Wzt carbohydrate-binding domain-containing protein n=1 Tax=Paraburkholderia atlantica TaxID=2654982 RepID=UPI003D1E832D
MSSRNVFSGRVVFDHLAKTAGQAVNDWLVKALGTGCVTPNLIGNHYELIRKYGGLYSVISAHVHFPDGESLDPRYQYMTLLREPVDRIVSWLYFLVNNHDECELPELVPAARRFLESDGIDLADTLAGSISNAYVEHFCRIDTIGLNDDTGTIERALAAIQQYDVVGIYEDMPLFLRDAARLIGMAAPSEISRVNVTQKRPAVDQIKPALRDRIIELNQLDLRFYSEIAKVKANLEREQSAEADSLAVSTWERYEPVRARSITTSALTILSVTLREGKDIRHGQLMTFDVDFLVSQKIGQIEMGIHIFDSDREWAFGTNSTLLGQTYLSLQSGWYRVTHHVVADLPAGAYTAGFAFAEQFSGSVEELAWRDSMCEFQVVHEVTKGFAGYSYLPATISLKPLEEETYEGGGSLLTQSFLGSDQRLLTQVGRKEVTDIVCTGKAGCLIFGPYIPLAAGRYHICVKGVVGNAGSGGARMDVAIDQGKRLIAENVFPERGERDCLISLPIYLDTPCIDLEIRVWVTDESDLRVSAFEISSLKPIEGHNLPGVERQIAY